MGKTHFIGIGGIGMSGLAYILLERGREVSGSDLRPNNLTDNLKDKGAGIFEGHSSNYINEDIDLIVRSSCIRDNNPEIKKAIELGIPVISRGEMLRSIMDEIPLSIAVTGTHGKTTTSAIIAHIMESCNMGATAVIGGELDLIGGNALHGRGEIIVAEVDESDGYFRNIGSKYGVVTNIEREHMEHYGSMENLLGAYKEFIDRISDNGIFFYNGQDSTLCEIAGDLSIRKSSFGIDGDLDVTCNIVTFGRNIEFELYYHGKCLGTVKSTLVGKHNIMNLLAAISVCIEMNIDFKEITDAVNSFNGVARRFEKIGTAGSIEIIEDYAHHPTELRAVIRAAIDYGQGRVITVFQPHRHSRTCDLADDFLHCFDDSDSLILTYVYSADEDPVKGTGIKEIFDKIDRKNFETLDLIKMEDVPDKVSQIVGKKDIVLILGAGDIREIGEEVVRKIKERV